MKNNKLIFIAILSMVVVLSALLVAVIVTYNDKNKSLVIENDKLNQIPAKVVPEKIVEVIEEIIPLSTSTPTSVIDPEDLLDDEGRPWQKFENDTLGLRFYYPISWGEPYLEPTGVITDLEEIYERYKGKDNGFEQALRINFPDSMVSIYLMNERSTYTHPVDPYISSIKLLKDIDSVCDLYKLSYAKHHYRQCENEVYTVLMSEGVNNTNYSRLYRLKNYGLTKLSNGFYDSAIAVDKLGWQAMKYGTNAPVLTLDEFMATQETSQEEYDKDKEAFVNFVNSFEPYEPKPVEKELNIIDENDSAEVGIIKEYYNHILNGEPEKAYNMYAVKKVSLDEYKSWYERTIMALITEVKNIENNDYQIMLDYEDHNKPVQRYRVVMRVESGKIEALSSEEITSDMISFGEMTAFAKKYQGDNYVILTIDGEEVVVEQANDDFMKEIANTLNFRNLHFSPQGNYLLYSAHGWEWSFGRIYDIANRRLILTKEVNTPHVFGVSQNEKYFYACAANDFGGEYYASVYELPQAELVFSPEDNGINGGFIYPDCEYDIENEKLLMNFNCPDWAPKDECVSEQSLEFDLVTGNVE